MVDRLGRRVYRHEVTITGGWIWGLALVSLVTGCPNARQEQPSAHHAATPPATVAPRAPEQAIMPPEDASSPGTLPSATASPAVQPSMPALASVQKLYLRSRQGGPSHPKCGGVISELTIDLAKSTWKRGLCMDDSKNASPNPNRPLDQRSGKLTPAHRTLVETEYAKLVPKPGPSCAADKGRVELTLTDASGASTLFVSPGTSCGDTPPDVADDLDRFHSHTFSITYKP